MATSRARSLMPDQTQSIPFNGSAIGAKNNVLRSHKKGAVGGKNEGTTTRTRKPLQDLNSRYNSEIDISSSKAKSLVSQKNQNAFKCEENLQKAALARKPLGDLTNSKKPQVKESSMTKMKNLSQKVSAVKEVNDVPDRIVEEGYLHNHNKCVEVQWHSMSMEYYLELIGLRKEFPPAVVVSQHPPSLPTSLEVETLPEYEDEDDIFLQEVPTPSPLSKLSCSPLRRPLRDWENVDLKLSPIRNL